MKISSSVQAQRQKGDSCLDDLQHAVYYMKYLRANYMIMVIEHTSHEPHPWPPFHQSSTSLNPQPKLDIKQSKQK